MSREIKFRAWHRNNNKMVDVKIIDFLNKKIFKDEVSYINFSNIELMQFTGLYDRNNKEIYEGDVLSDGNTDRHYKVVFENGSYRAEFEEYSLDLFDVAHFCEVVGNIYENELLGGLNG